MTKSITFENPLINGIHARPAAEIEAVTQVFQSNITLKNLTRSTFANAKSVLAMISAGVIFGDLCELCIEGNDEEQAYESLKEFIVNTFPYCDEQLAELEASDTFPLPVSLEKAKPDYLRGTVVSSGICMGTPVSFSQLNLSQLAADVDANFHGKTDCQTMLTLALHALCEEIESALNSSSHQTKEEQAIQRAHFQIAKDSTFIDELLHAAEGPNPIRAISAAAHTLKAPLLQSESAYLRERALDIDDICARLASKVLGHSVQQNLTLSDNSIVIADNLTPSEFLALDKELLKGIVLNHAGQTSHTVILARSFGVPILTGIDGANTFVQSADTLILDAEYGCLIRNPNANVHRFYTLEMEKNQAKADRLLPFLNQNGQSKDGKHLALYANIAIGMEAEASFKRGAEGIGLFRTEMLFMDAPEAPTEEAQYDIYKQVLSQANGKQVIVRTLDIGGDKPLDYLPLGEEENPFLGYRAVRMYPEFQAIIEGQIRALLRASVHGDVDIMIPMISCVEEVKWVHALCLECEQKLKQAGTQVGNWRLGMMVEVPAAKYVIEKVKDLISFVSIGSNDLTQYFMACDRGNPRTTSLYNAFHPSFIAFLRDIATAAKHSEVELGICGEMASDINSLPLLLAMGFDEMSVSSPNITKLRAALAKLDSESCTALLNKVIGASTVEDVNSIISDFWTRQANANILDASLVIRSNATQKSEVIKQLTDNLETYERAPRADLVERAIWDREAIFATSLGFGVAIPHCKSAAVTRNSVSVAHLSEPLVWNEAENEKVSTVIMLTMSEAGGDAHMNIFSKLARKLMHAEFRKQLEQAGCDEQTYAERTITLLNACLFDQAA